jgi:hypothetical protein
LYTSKHSIEAYDDEGGKFYGESWLIVRFLYQVLKKVIEVTAAFILTLLFVAPGLFVIQDKVPTETNYEASRRSRLGFTLLVVGQLCALLTVYSAGLFS